LKDGQRFCFFELFESLNRSLSSPSKYVLLNPNTVYKSLYFLCRQRHIMLNGYEVSRVPSDTPTNNLQ
jgi:hypothetical protein